jgi:GTP-binding protein EngB required for normal cell division
MLPQLNPGMQEPGKQLADLLDDIDRRERENAGESICKVAIVGRFSAGKSQLINALLGSEVMPRNTDECTTLCTEVRYGEEILYHKETARGWHSVERDDYLNAVDRTIQTESGGGEGDDARFRIYLPNPMLRNLCLMDTPGYGSEKKTGERIVKTVETAAAWADICVMVVDISKLGDDLVEFAGRILAQCPSVLLLVNKSDRMDSEEIEAISRQIETETAVLLKTRIPYYFVSALWQSVAGAQSGPDAAVREAILAQREMSEPGPPPNQWAQMQAYLQDFAAESARERLRSQLAAIDRALESVRRFDARYDRKEQAEFIFLDQIERIKPQMPPPMGPSCLESATRSARQKEPLPWERLAVFGVDPAFVAPEVALMPKLGQFLAGKYVHLSGQIAQDSRFCDDQVLFHSMTGRLSRIATEFAALAPQHEPVSQMLSWRSLWLPDSFAYEETLAHIGRRWNHTKEMEADDTGRVRQQLQDIVHLLKETAGSGEPHLHDVQPAG